MRKAGAGRAGGEAGIMRGFFYTLDATVALLVLALALMIVSATLEAGPNEPRNFVQLKQISRDSLALMEKKGYLADSLAQGNASRAFIGNTPPSLCMELELYRNASESPVFSTEKTGCLKSAERFDVTWRSFLVRNGTSFVPYMAKLTSWYKRE